MKTRTLMRTRARALRKSMSEPEVMLWSRLRGGGGERPRFRRQHPIENIIVDFFCPAAPLAIEVDGSTHWSDEKHAQDAARDRWLEAQGILTLRIPASSIYRDLTEVVDGILLLVDELRRSTPAPTSPIAGAMAGGGPPAEAAGPKSRGWRGQAAGNAPTTAR